MGCTCVSNFFDCLLLKVQRKIVYLLEHKNEKKYQLYRAPKNFFYVKYTLHFSPWMYDFKNAAKLVINEVMYVLTYVYYWCYTQDTT